MDRCEWNIVGGKPKGYMTTYSYKPEGPSRTNFLQLGERLSASNSVGTGLVEIDAVDIDFTIGTVVLGMILAKLGHNARVFERHVQEIDPLLRVHNLVR